MADFVEEISLDCRRCIDFTFQDKNFGHCHWLCLIWDMTVFKISDSASIKINRLRSRYISIIFAISDKLLIGKACSPSVSAGDLWPRRSAVSWLYCCLPQDYSIIDTSCPSLRGTLTKNTSKHWFRFGAVIFLLSGNINELHFAPREIFYKDAWMTLSNIVGLM